MAWPMEVTPKYTNASPLQWWGYRHANGSVHLKRWFGDVRDYTTDCEGNDFVAQVVQPFDADTQKQAWDYLVSVVGAPTCN